MSHEIEVFADGQAAYVGAREDAWHRLGTTLDSAFTAEEALTQAHLAGWNVRKIPLTATEVTDDGVSQIEIPNQFATVRTHPIDGSLDYLGVVGGSYRPIQNEEHTEFLNTLVDESGAHFETAGSLRGGTEVFVTMKMPQGILIGGEDPIDLYLAAFNSHNGSSAFKVITTPVRVVCANTQAAALKNIVSEHSIRHTRHADRAIQAARDALQMSFAYNDAFAKEAEQLLGQKFTANKFSQVVKFIFEDRPGDENKRAQKNWDERNDTLQWLYSTAPTQEHIKGTKWGAYQAFTEYMDHYAPVRLNGSNEEKSIKSAERALSNVASDIKMDVWDILTGELAMA